MDKELCDYLIEIITWYKEGKEVEVSYDYDCDGNFSNYSVVDFEPRFISDLIEGECDLRLKQ